jgi:hypothetical protein
VHVPALGIRLRRLTWGSDLFGEADMDCSLIFIGAITAIGALVFAMILIGNKCIFKADDLP